jgi:hypothetical protein
MWHFFYSGPRFATVHSHTVVHQSRHEAVRPTGRIKSEKNVEIFFKKKKWKIEPTSKENWSSKTQK